MNIPTSLVRRVVEAQRRLRERGIEPTELYLTRDDFTELPLGINLLLGMPIRCAEQAFVAGYPEHGRYQVVGREREILAEEVGA